MTMTVDEALDRAENCIEFCGDELEESVETLRHYVEEVREVESAFLQSSYLGGRVVAQCLAAAREGRSDD